MRLASLSSDARTYDDGYRAGIEFARNEITSSAYPSAPTTPITLFFATLKSIDGPVLSIQINAERLDPSKTGFIDKKVRITDKTAIRRVVMKMQDQLEKDISDYQIAVREYQSKVGPDATKAKEDGLTMPPLPQDFIASDALIGDLNIGDQLKIVVQSDIRQAHIVNAYSVEFLHNQNSPDFDPQSNSPVSPP